MRKSGLPASVFFGKSRDVNFVLALGFGVVLYETFEAGVVAFLSSVTMLGNVKEFFQIDVQHDSPASLAKLFEEVKGDEKTGTFSVSKAITIDTAR